MEIKYKCGCILRPLGNSKLSEWEQCKKHKNCENINRCKLDEIKEGR